MESIAFATKNQVAKATVAHATVYDMTPDELQKWRAKRLDELAKQLGGKTALGKKLKHKDGAYVGQMIRGERPITEKTIFVVEGWPGCANWFSLQEQVAGSTPIEQKTAIVAQEAAKTYILDRAWPFSNLSRQQWDTLDQSQKSMVEGMALGLFMSKKASTGNGEHEDVQKAG